MKNIIVAQNGSVSGNSKLIVSGVPFIPNTSGGSGGYCKIVAAEEPVILPSGCWMTGSVEILPEVES